MSAEPCRDLTQSFQQRQTATRVEFAQWRDARPNFTSQELLQHWRQIREWWGLHDQPAKAKAAAYRKAH